jgi:hypothetical protein
MPNIRVVGTFSFQVLQPNDYPTSISITMSIDRAGWPSGLKHSINVDGGIETISPLITCFKNDIIYWKASAPESSYILQIKSFTKKDGDNVLEYPSLLPDENCSTTAEQLGQERFSIIFIWLSPNREIIGEVLIQGDDGGRKIFTVDPYISCN